MTENNDNNEMEPLASLQVQQNQIPVEIKLFKNSTTSNGEEVERMMNQVINLNSKNVVHEPTCPICSSSLRKEIEQKYIESNENIGEVRKFYTDRTGEEIELSVLKNHLKTHIESGIREIQKVEYASRVKRLYNQNLSTLDAIAAGLAIVMERIINVNSLLPTENESLADIERIKCSETVKLMGQTNNLLKLRASILGEMKSSGDMISIPANEFVNTFLDAINNAKTDMERQVLANLFSKFEALSKKTV